MDKTSGYRTLAPEGSGGQPAEILSPDCDPNAMLKRMARLVGAVLGTCFVLAMAATMVGSERWLAAWALSAGAVALLVGWLTNPRATASAGVGLLGVGLIAGGRPMEGVGVLTLLAAAALNRPDAADTTTE